MADSVPIYWGNPSVQSLFNTASFVNLNTLSFDEAAARIKFLDANDTAYVEVRCSLHAAAMMDGMFDRCSHKHGCHTTSWTLLYTLSMMTPS